ncbi:hypothetical protein SESBI_16318 [Sesbania bispinosa]|nr:hypothetical protein SESBI_16318 [Sesbania bispinosa]
MDILMLTTRVGRRNHQIYLGVVKDSIINQGLPINIKHNLAIKGAIYLLWKVLWGANFQLHD